MSSFDAAARRLHPDSYKQEATSAAPVVEKKKKQKKRKAEPVLPAVGDVVAARGLRKGDDAEARGTVTKIKRAKRDDKKSKRGDRVYRIALEGGGSRKTRLTHLDWRLVRRDTKSFLDTMRSGAKIVAPMVGGSELAFRLLCRRHGANVAYTPMLEAAKFLDDAEFKTQFFQTHAEDKPLVAHFCGNDPAIVGAACKEAARLGADAVDLNLGCPQRVAYAGHYGSYLMKQEDRELVKSIVRAMRRDTPPEVVVCVKIRLMDTQPDTLQLVEDLRDSGAQVVALHGRQRATWHRDGPGARDGPANLDAIRQVKEAVGDSVVIVSNGNVRNCGEADEALALTKAGGVMSAEGLLNDPALFEDAVRDDETQERLRKIALALEYLDLVDEHGNPAGYRSIAFHCRRIAKDALDAYDALDELLDGPDVAAARKILERCRQYSTGEKNYEEDAAKKASAKKRAADRLRTREARKRFEGRMIRKAKREGKALDFYVKQGLDKPSPDDLRKLRSINDEKARLAAWNAKHRQHCIAFHLSSCKRGDSCAFLHDAVVESADLVSG